MDTKEIQAIFEKLIRRAKIEIVTEYHYAYPELYLRASFQDARAQVKLEIRRMNDENYLHFVAGLVARNLGDVLFLGKTSL